jgi:formiminotetrahydrofolate cyclodeaminase
MYGDNTINNYLNALASRAPAPGGGSAAALIGAIGIAALSKVVNFTIGKEKYKSAEEEMVNIQNSAKALGSDCNRLCSEDAAAYAKLSRVFKMPKGPMRENRVQAALKEAIEVPLEVCRKCHEAIKLCLPVARKGNANLITDTGIASIMLASAFQSALLNVEINIKGIKDEKFIRETRDTLGPMEKEVSAVDQKVKDEVDKHIKR